jgi:ABC-type branched-subunit amino acid transport system ATPase component
LARNTMLNVAGIQLRYSNIPVIHDVSFRVEQGAAQKASTLSGGEQQMVAIAAAS